MFIYYLKMIWRFLQNQRTYSIINIGGLTIGIASCIFIMIFVQDEFQYDAFHDKLPQIYQLLAERESGATSRVVSTSSYPTAGALKEQFAAIEDVTHLLVSNVDVQKDRDTFSAQMLIADSSFWRIFDFPLENGSDDFPNGVNRVWLTAQNAKTYFGDLNPVGQAITVRGRFFDYYSFEAVVAGVLKDIPRHSSIQFDMAVDMVNLAPLVGNFLEGFENDWGSNFLNTYVLLKEGHSWEEVGSQIRGLVGQNAESGGSENRFLTLHPYADIYLNPRTTANMHQQSSSRYSYILIAIGLFILVIAAVNYVNLATAQLSLRLKEVGVKKVLGSNKNQLMLQFFLESIMISLVALILALALVEALMPFFEELFLKTFASSPLLDTRILGSALFVTLFCGILAGSYPALYLSRLLPIQSLRGILKYNPAGARFRRGLVIFQFVLSTILIIGISTMNSQLAFLRDSDVGFEREKLLVVYSGLWGDDLDRFRNETGNIPNIQAVTASSHLLGSSSTMNFGSKFEGHEDEISMSTSMVDYEFFETLVATISEGRDFSEGYATDAEAAFIINEAGARFLGWDDPVGKEVNIGLKEGQIVGVVKDFNFASLRYEIRPMLFTIYPSLYRNTYIRLDGREASETIASIEGIWKKLFPERNFEYQFLDDQFAENFADETRLEAFVKYLSVIAVFVACIGLFGLTAFTVERRRREIGVRKVLGATTASIVQLLSKEYLLLLVIANLLAAPLAFFIMDEWLAQYATRISMGSTFFIVAASVTVLVGAMSIGLQVIRASMTNPVESLKYE